jgi:hypothetical protein
MVLLTVVVRTLSSCYIMTTAMSWSVVIIWAVVIVWAVIVVVSLLILESVFLFVPGLSPGVEPILEATKTMLRSPVRTRVTATTLMLLLSMDSSLM